MSDAQGLGECCQDRMNGSSAAAPMVTGVVVVALMLEANPALGDRDVQEILALSARPNCSAAS